MKKNKHKETKIKQFKCSPRHAFPGKAPHLLKFKCGITFMLFNVENLTAERSIFRFCRDLACVEDVLFIKPDCPTDLKLNF